MTILKKLNSFKLKLTGLILSGSFFLTNRVFGQIGPITDGGIELKNPLGQNSIINIINNVLTYLIYISFPILALMILIAGFQIMTAQDNPEKIKKGKTTITYAVIGFIIILISKGSVLIILNIIK
ncbi:hypothetical protein JW698_01195 [Candidatus Wolfebacteria bacterium]|nr:hypothetical protein [Candidatus Wolfebacteria bacterium]